MMKKVLNLSIDINDDNEYEDDDDFKIIYNDQLNFNELNLCNNLLHKDIIENHELINHGHYGCFYKCNLSNKNNVIGIKKTRTVTLNDFENDFNDMIKVSKKCNGESNFNEDNIKTINKLITLLKNDNTTNINEYIIIPDNIINDKNKINNNIYYSIKYIEGVTLYKYINNIKEYIQNNENHIYSNEIDGNIIKNIECLIKQIKFIKNYLENKLYFHNDVTLQNILVEKINSKSKYYIKNNDIIEELLGEYKIYLIDFEKISSPTEETLYNNYDDIIKNLQDLIDQLY